MRSGEPLGGRERTGVGVGGFFSISVHRMILEQNTSSNIAIGVNKKKKGCKEMERKINKHAEESCQMIRSAVWLKHKLSS